MANGTVAWTSRYMMIECPYPLSFALADLSFGETVHGLVGKAGMIRLMRDHSVEVDWLSNRVMAVAVTREAAEPVTTTKSGSHADRFLAEFSDVFRDELPGLPPRRATDITIPRLDREPNRKLMFRRVHLSHQEESFLYRYVMTLRRQGLVRPTTTSPYNSPLFCVPKALDHPDPDKHYRPVMDPRAVNKLFARKSTVLPRIPETIQRVATARFATVVDLLAGFHQVRVPEDLVPFLAFTLADGSRYEWLVWPFGFINSPFAMETMVNGLIKGLRNTIAYVDDIIIVTPDTTEEGESPTVSLERDLQTHIRAVRAFLDRCRDEKVYLSRAKAQLLSPVVDVLGTRVEVGKAIRVLPSRAAD